MAIVDGDSYAGGLRDEKGNELPPSFSRYMAVFVKDGESWKVAAFRSLDCQGLARVDFFVGPDGSLTINEINTMPGLTPISMFPRMWAVTGVDYPTLLSILIDTAVARGTGLR